MDKDTLLKALLTLVPMIMSLTVHEWAHAMTAYRLGDDTAARQGRLTLNPLVHIDPIGTILLPLVFALSGTGFSFGWARPVPVNPARFRRDVRMKTGLWLTALAGPASNLVLATLMAIIFKVISMQGMPDAALAELVLILLFMNVALAVFNMLPVPPLDGSRVVLGLLPDRAERGVTGFLEQYPFVIIIAFFALIRFGGELIQWPVIQVARGLLWVTGNGA